MNIRNFLFTSLGTALTALISGCSSTATSPADQQLNEAHAGISADLVFVNARIYTAPGEAPINRGTLIINNGEITAVRDTRTGDLQLSAGRVINAAGRALTAGLWNSHVHFTAPNLATNPQGELTDMLLSFGFTHVVDTGSTLDQTIRLRRAINSGALHGPHIVLANGSFVYTDGTPSYLPGITLPEVTAAADATPMVNATLNAGADGIKIFAGSFITPAKTILLPSEIIRAVSAAAHERGSFVVAHPTTIEGLSNAVVGKVDVIAHTTAPQVEVPGNVLTLMLEQNTALIPTLMLWRNEMLKFGQSEAQADFMESAAVQQLANLHDAGVTILFGTDVGYMADFNTAAEYRLMQEAGMSWSDIHAALTTNPTKQFGTYADRKTAVISEGASADLVLFEGDPARQIETLADVAYTVIGGAVVYDRTGAKTPAKSQPHPQPGL